MKLRLLRIFEAVCETGGVTDAAARLGMTQPAVTHAIRLLEAESGLALFDRLSRRLHLTESGRLYRDKTRRILELCDELEESSAGLERLAVLRVGSCITIACFWLPAILRDFSRKGDGRRARVRVASAGAILAMLEQNEIDLALYEGVDPGPPFLSFPFSRYRLTAVCAPDHPFAGKGKVSLDALLGENLLLREPGSAIRDVFDGFLRLRQRAADPFMTSVNSQALVQAAKGGLGVSLLPETVVRREIAAGELAAFSVTGMRLENENRIVFHRDKEHSAGLRLFIECASGAKL